MAIRVNPKLIDELERYGAEDVAKCYHCGNCSAVCPFSKEPYTLPAPARCALQIGLEERLEGDPRALALLLLRRVLGPVPARRRARRDDDEPAALADGAVRLHRHLAALLPLVEGRVARDPRRRDPHRRGFPVVRLLGRAACTSTTARTRSCPARASTSSTGARAHVLARCSAPTASACGGSPWAGQGPPGCLLPSYLRRPGCCPCTSSRRSGGASAIASGRGCVHLVLVPATSRCSCSSCSSSSACSRAPRSTGGCTVRLRCHGRPRRRPRS
jgi:ferredoxin